jgi:hypothetical protein
LFPIPPALNEHNAAAREDSLMRSFRRTAAGLTVLGLLFTTGCQGSSNGEAEPLPPSETLSSPSETPPSSSPSPTEPAWQDDYSQKQIAAYEAALERFETYEQRSEPIWRRGKATPGAEELFKEYFIEGYWQSQQSKLRIYEEAEVSTSGLAKVLWSRPTHVSNGVVRIRQCVDYRPTTTTQRGEETRPVKSRQRPVIRLIGLSKDGGTPWQIYELVTEPRGKDQPCTPRS